MLTQVKHNCYFCNKPFVSKLTEENALIVKQTEHKAHIGLDFVCPICKRHSQVILVSAKLSEHWAE